MAEPVERLVGALFNPDELIEIRCCPEVDGAGSTQRWVRASEVGDVVQWMRSQQDDHHRFPCIGINPRARAGGGVNDVAACRTLYVDLDGVAEDQAMALVAQHGLPVPSYAQSTGNGSHVMWRLAEPLTAKSYRDAMNRLGDLLGGDKAVRDAARVLRVPGFENRKPKSRRRDGSYPVCRAILSNGGQTTMAQIELVLGDVETSAERESQYGGGYADPSELGEAALHPETRRFLAGGCVDGERRDGIVNAVYDLLGRGVAPNLVFDLVNTAAEKCGVVDPDYVDRAVRSGLARGVGPRFHAADAVAAGTPADFSFSRPPKGGGSREIKSAPAEPSLRVVPLSELGEAVEPDWIWAAHEGPGGYVAPGLVTQLTGLWKAGKTTLLKHLIRDAVAGEGLCEKPIDGDIVVVSEEPTSIWARRRDELDLPDAVGLLKRHSHAKADFPQWFEIIDFLADLARSGQAKWVIFDTIAAVWPVADENDASAMLAALAPLRQITEAGAALLLVHHPRKSGGEEFTAGRGSGAFPGFVDILVELSRVPGDHATTERVIKASGRYEVPPEIRIDYRGPDQGFVVQGDNRKIRRERDDEMVMEILGIDRWMSVKEVRNAWKATHGAEPWRDDKIRSRLNDLAQDGRVEARDGTAEGRGRPGRMYRIPRA